MSVPHHVAIIMDGNGRWAQARGLPRLAGHKAGVDAVRRMLEAAKEAGIKIITLYAFSTENWQRPADEVEGLMGLLRFYLKSELTRLHEEGVRLRVIGDVQGLDADIQSLVKNAEDLTASNTHFTLCIALNYGGRQELTAAARQLAAAAVAGQLDAAAITPEDIDNALYTVGIPNPDLLIRTSGEHRVSNFMLWQLAYTEFYFTETLWPDFSKTDLQAALEDYGQRERRFGGLSKQTTNQSTAVQS